MMWNEFLPMSMPITLAIAPLCLLDMACSLSLLPHAQLRSLAGPEHGRTIPLTDIETNPSRGPFRLIDESRLQVVDRRHRVWRTPHEQPEGPIPRHKKHWTTVQSTR